MTRLQSWRAALLGVPWFVVAGCSGGSDPPSDRAQVPDRDYFQVYATFDATGTTLTLVDAANFGARIPLGDVDGFDVLHTGTLAGATVTNWRPDTLVYAQGDRWRKISLRHNGSRQPVIVSAAPGDHTVCMTQTVEQSPASTAGAFVLFTAAGADGQCMTADDVHRKFGLNDSATTPATGGPAVDWFNLHALRTPHGDLIALLAHDDVNDTLAIHDASLELVTSLANITSYQMLHASGDRALVMLNGSLRQIDATGAVGEPLHSGSGYASGAVLADDTYLYFFDSLLYRVRLDGSAPAQPIAHVLAYGYSYANIAALLADQVVLSAGRNWGGEDLVLVSKVPPSEPEAPAVVDSAASFWVYTTVAPVAYQANAFDAAASAARLLDAAGARTDFGTEAEWSGVRYSRDMPAEQPFFGAQALGAFLVHGITDPQSHGGGTLSHLNFADHGWKAVTPINEPGVVFVEAWGSMGMGIVATGDFLDDFTSDVFSFDLEDARIERHTNGPGSDFPFAF